MERSEERRGWTPAGVSSLVAIVAVIVLVSLPRLHAFAVEENETDAAVLARRLAQALGDAPGDGQPASLAALVDELGMRDRTDDLEWLADGRVLRRHGYLFELDPPHAAPRALRAWPWSYGATGRTAFLAHPSDGVRRHANDDGSWSGVARPPHGSESGWDELGPTDPSTW